MVPVTGRYFNQFSDPAQAQRAEIVRKNKRRSAPIIDEHKDEGATPSAIFIPQQLPPLDPAKRPYSPDVKPQIQVVNSDTFLAVRELMNAIGDDAKSGTAVLNLASDEVPGGGYTSLHTAQASHIDVDVEECLCYSSTLYHTLDPLTKHYPWPNKGPDSIKGIYSPGVVIFRGPLHGSSTSEFCPELPSTERKIVSIITVAAPRYPLLTPDRLDFKNPSDKEDLREKVRLILRMAGSNGQKYLVLGALGCGAYRCPPSSVARDMKSVLEEPEFAGWFKRILFAVYSSQSVGHGNFDIFKQVFES
ncbi:hypothetical protein D9758_004846 [Tetrapyrgos nigripes]|uniref:Microbial-type PARG catalytic domain-containing protein n=1 Tax=Tetrapyrgos nigripes TaxID=182062 RepID=A0A8H5G5W0_9AGAR|nr:hypothetical protein D9758_004846 [Tetrapyrgos nigripes]